MNPNLLFKYYWFFIIGLIGAFLIFILILFIPTIYNAVYGNNIIKWHMNEVIGNKTNHEEIAFAYLNWSKENIHYARDEEGVLTIASFGIYRINNKTRLFFRNPPASWIIKTKLGRCGEFAKYFVEMMNKSGYRARYIKPEGWDHAWAEYFTTDGYKITVDTSGGTIISDLKKWIGERNVTKVMAFDVNGSKEDISPEYLG